MILVESYADFWRHYVDFTGRTDRSAFWFALLDHFIVIWGAAMCGAMASVNKNYAVGVFFLAILWLYGLAIVVPAIAIEIRRLRDAGFPWGLYFLGFVPLFGLIALIVLWCMPTVQPSGQSGQAPAAPAATSSMAAAATVAATPSATPSAALTVHAAVEKPQKLTPDLPKNPYYGAGAADALPAFVKNTANYTGRSTRSEFWWVMLFLVPYYLVAAAFSIASPAMLPLWMLLPMIPYVGLVARRYTDAGVPKVIGIIQALWGVGCELLQLTMAVQPASQTVLGPTYSFMLMVNVISGLGMLVIVVMPSKPLIQVASAAMNHSEHDANQVK